jgi:hypothetical protein
MSAPTDLELLIFTSSVDQIVHHLDEHSRYQYPDLESQVNDLIEIFRTFDKEDVNFLRYQMLRTGEFFASQIIVCTLAKCTEERVHELLMDVCEMLINVPKEIGRKLLHIETPQPMHTMN